MIPRVTELRWVKRWNLLAWVCESTQCRSRGCGR